MPPRRKRDEDFDMLAGLRQLGEQITKQAIRPNIHGYTPHEKQEIFHESPAYGRLFIGGNRSGKTVGGVAEDIYWLRRDHPHRKLPISPGEPVRGRVVGVDFKEGVYGILIPEYKRWLPPSLLINGSWDDSYSKSLDILTLSNGSQIEFMSYEQDTAKFAGVSRHFCVDKETKILSRTGWSSIGTLLPGDEILTRGATGSYEWKPINFMYEAISEKMYRLKSRNNFDALVTADHRWLVYNKKTKKEYYTTTEKLKKSEQLIVAADEVTLDKEASYSDAFVALVGWLITDGSVAGYNFNIGQSLSYNNKKCDKIETLLKEIGARYYINDAPYENDGVMRYFQIRGAARESLRSIVGPDKDLPYWFINSLTTDQLHTLLDAIIAGDGQYLSSGKWTVTATRQQHVDAITYLAVLCGYRVNNYPTKHGWQVINGKTWTGTRYDYRKVSVDSLDITIEDYNDAVWCPNTDNSNFVAYRGGRVFLTGNCHFDEEPPKHIYDECMMRLLDTDGSWWITMTPLLGMTWLYDDIYLKAKEEGNEELLKVIEVSNSENPYLPQAGRKRILEGLSSDDDRAAREHGTFIEVGGKIFKDFSVETHVIENFNPNTAPNGPWRVYMSIDSGWKNPTAIMWHAVNPIGQVVTFAEHYASEMLVADHVKAIESTEKAFGIKDVFIRTGDPAMRQTREGTGTSMQQEYAMRGIYLSLENVPAGPGSVAVGIARMQQYMSGAWKITRNCTNLVRELGRLHWATYASKNMQQNKNPQENVHKKDDHAFDSSRYFFTLMPDLSPEAIEQARTQLVNGPVIPKMRYDEYLVAKSKADAERNGTGGGNWTTTETFATI